MFWQMQATKGPIRPSRGAVGWCLSAMVSLFLLSFTAPIGRCQSRNEKAPAPDESDWHFRYDLFQMLLEERGLTTVSRIEDVFDRAKESVIVLAGDLRNFPDATFSRLSRWVSNGGALLIATDQPTIIAGVGTFGSMIVQTQDATDQYEGFSDCLRVRDLGKDHPALRGVDELVTNRSTYFVPTTGRALTWESIAVLPKNSDPRVVKKKTLVSIGVPSSGDRDGILIVSADASLFSNNMLWHGDNAIFAIRLSEQLAPKQRKYLCFMVEGEVQPSYRTTLPKTEPTNPSSAKSPETSVEKLLRLTNAAIRNVEESNVLNEALRQQPRYLAPEAYHQMFLTLAMMIAILGLLWLLIRTRTVSNIVQSLRTMRSALDLKSMARIASSDFRSPASNLARELCMELTGSKRSADWQNYIVALRQERDKGGWKANELNLLDAIFDLACRGSQHGMSGLEFQKLGKAILDLRARHRARAERKTP